MTGLTPEERFENHKTGVKAARVVRKFGVRLVRSDAHLNPMPYVKAEDGSDLPRACENAAISSELNE